MKWFELMEWFKRVGSKNAGIAGLRGDWWAGATTWDAGLNVGGAGSHRWRSMVSGILMWGPNMQALLDSGSFGGFERKAGSGI
jgi:hypothetical protein